MKKILHITLYIVIISMVLISVAGIYRFNFTNAGDIIPGITAPALVNL